MWFCFNTLLSLTTTLDYHPQGRGRRRESISGRRGQGRSDLWKQFREDHHRCQGQLQPRFVLMSFYILSLLGVFSPQLPLKCKWGRGTERRIGLYFPWHVFWMPDLKQNARKDFGCSPVWKGNSIALQRICISNLPKGGRLPAQRILSINFWNK